MKKVILMQRPEMVFADKSYVDQVCLEPFNTVEVGLQGYIRLCGCSPWMPIPVGNIYTNTIQEILNSPIAQAVRESIRNGTFRYCNEKTCGIIANEGLMKRSAIEQMRVKPIGWDLFLNDTAPKMPTSYFIAGDQLCNLSCPSCRTELMHEDAEQRDEKERIFDDVINRQIFNGSDTRPISIVVSTSGEVFSSPLLFNFVRNFPLDRYPKTRFSLNTNGLLVKSKWSKISHLSKNIKHITVSVDSCREQIYEQLRRGGKFDNLVENVQFIKQLSREHGFTFSLKMVVQQANYDHIEEFYSWSKSMGAHFVDYTRILNYNLFTDQEFAKLDVLHPYHDGYAEAVRQLQLCRQRRDVKFYGFNLNETS